MIIIYISGFGQADARATSDCDRGHHANEAGHLAGLGDGDSGRTRYCRDRGRQCAHRVDEPESAVKGSIRLIDLARAHRRRALAHYALLGLDRACQFEGADCRRRDVVNHRSRLVALAERVVRPETRLEQPR